MADRSFFGDGEDVPGWIAEEMRDSFPGSSILLVEDDPDIRELLATLLRLAGFEPTVCSNAEFGLEQLREQPFDLVLTDYALPNRNGGWLLQQAAAEGLLDATPVLVVTAHPNPADVEGYEVICKPFDLDDLVARVKLRLEGRRKIPPVRKIKRTPASPGGDGEDGGCPDPIELILYVSATSPKSAATLANIKRVLSRLRSSQVKLTIYDLTRDPNAGVDDSVVFRSALVRRSPGPRTFILGHITNADVLVELLQACGEQMS